MTASVRIIRNPIELRKKVRVVDINSSDSPVLLAENELAKLEPNFDEWLSQMIDHLRTQSKKIERGEVAPLSDTELFRAAFDIHGQASTLGYASIGRVAELLCDFLQTQQTLTADGIAVTYQCVETIGAMSREQVRDTDNPIASQLINTLEIFIEKKKL